MIAPFGMHKNFWTPERKHSLYLGIALFIFSIFIQVKLGHYSSRRAIGANSVGDIFLDNLPVLNLDFLIVGGDILLWAFGLFLLVREPRRLLFGIKAIGIFNVVRAFFISLTHIGPYPYQFSPGPQNMGYGVYHLFTFQGNYFFSGHTGLPFLFALLFWDRDIFRVAFLALTVIFGATVLLAHVHYSIDVFAAPFIVYGVVAITAKLFPGDHALLRGA